MQQTDDSVAHTGGCDDLFADSSGREIARAETGGDSRAHSGIHSIGRLDIAEGIAQHHPHGEDLSNGVGNAFARDIGSGSAGGLVETESFLAPAAEVFSVTMT